MNLEDLNLSCIKKKPSLSDLSCKDISQLEWRFSDCLKLSNKENILEEIDVNRQDRNGANGVNRPKQKQSLFNSSSMQELQDRNKFLEFINQNNEQKLQILDKENAQLRQKLQERKIKKRQSVLSQQKIIQTSAGIENNILKPNNQLQNIPESESEETPLNRPTLRGYQRNTVSFSQHSVDQDGSGGMGSKKRKKSEQKINMLLNSGGTSNLGSSVRRLFSSSITNTPQVNNQNSGDKTNQIYGFSDNKYDLISPKVDSNLEKKPYHEEIVRKNKLKYNFQTSLNSSLCQNDSNDITIANINSQQNSQIKSTPLQNDETKSTITQNMCFEDLNHVYNAPNQNVNVKLKYYQYLLEESFFQHDKFTQHVSQSINNEYQEFKAFQWIDMKQCTKLQEIIEKQQQQIQDLQQQLSQHRTKSEQLSQLVYLYKEQMTGINNNNEIMFNQIKKIQDELSTIDLFFQFDNLDEIRQSDNSLKQSFESIPQIFNSGIDRIKQNFSQLVERIQVMNKIIDSNKEEFNKNLEIIKNKLEQQLQIHNNDQNMNSLSNQNVNSDVKSLYEELSETVEKTIEVMQKLQKQNQNQCEIIEKNKLQQECIKQLYLSFNSEQQTDFDKILDRLKEQFTKLRKQQIRLEDEIFNVRIDKKRTIYMQLKSKLECKFMHSSKAVEQEILDIFNKFDQCCNHQKENPTNHECQNNQQTQQADGQELKSNNIYQNQKDSFNTLSLCKSLYLIVNSQHENIQEHKKVILELLKLLEWLEIFMDVDSEGNLKINESFLTEITSPELVEWANTFKKNISISIQQHIKRQIDSKVEIPKGKRNKLKNLIYSGDYNNYFSLLIQILSSSSNNQQTQQQKM